MSKIRRDAIIICTTMILALLTGCAGEAIEGVLGSIPDENDVLSDISIAVAPKDETYDNDEPESLSIAGEWTMLRNTYSIERDGPETLEDNRQPVLQTMLIYADNTFRLEFHGHGTIEGVLNNTGENEYTVESFTLTNEMGEREHRDDVRWLRYDPESDLLRNTSFSIEENKYLHTHYERADDGASITGAATQGNGDEKKEIVEITFAHSGITDEILEALIISGEIPKNTTHLHLQVNQISDLSPLRSLTELNTLSINNNQIIDISVLQSLTKLRYLDLSDNQISDVSTLSFLKGLTILRLSDNKISDVSHLQSLTELEYLGLNHNVISDIASLHSLTNLYTLLIGYNQVSDTQIDDIKKALPNSEINTHL